MRWGDSNQPDIQARSGQSLNLPNYVRQSSAAISVRSTVPVTPGCLFKAGSRSKGTYVGVSSFCDEEKCTSTDGGSGYDCCASMDWGEPQTCSDNYIPKQKEEYCQYTCCKPELYFRFTAGDGSKENDESDGDTAVIMIPLADLPQDEELHDFKMTIDTENHRIELEVDGRPMAQSSSSMDFPYKMWADAHPACVGGGRCNPETRAIAAGGDPGPWQGRIEGALQLSLGLANTRKKCDDKGGSWKPYTCQQMQDAMHDLFSGAYSWEFD